jgi:6-phosphogluconolactonase
MGTRDNTVEMFNLLIGTYTEDNSKGISVYHFDAKNGRPAYISDIEGVANASYLCIKGNGRLVYAVNENSYDRAGGVSALSFDPESGILKLINQQPTGRGPCYVSVDEALKHALVANYADGSFSVFPLGEDGALLPVIQHIQQEGSGPDQDRQEQPHVHAAVLSPDESHALFTDLGTDRVYIYPYQPMENSPLGTAAPATLQVNPGDGPRHIGFTPDKKFMYLITEMGACVYVYAYDGPQSTHVQTTSLVADGFEGAVGGGDLLVSPDGRFLYTSNRGDANEIVVFAIDEATGKLSFVERISSMGKSPRNLVIDPSGNYLLVANESSHDIYVYSILKDTGKLVLTEWKIDINSPCCLKFTELRS